MDNFTNYIKELETIFKKHAKEETKVKQKKFLVNNFEFYGVLTTVRKPLVKPLLQKWNKELNLQQKKLLFKKMYKQDYREFQYTAMEFINYWWKKGLTFNDLDWVLKIIKHNIWWDTTDYFDHLFGVIIFNETDIKKAHNYLYKLIINKDDWVKRIAIQSQLMLKEEMDIDLLFTLITPLLKTNNFYLIRSIGWSLRNAKRINSSKVNRFIKKHEVSKKIISVINEH